jgi:hypothetical protein
MNVLRRNMQSIPLLLWDKQRSTSYLNTLLSAKYRTEAVLSNFVNGCNSVENRYMPSVPGRLQSGVDPWLKAISGLYGDITWLAEYLDRQSVDICAWD